MKDGDVVHEKIWLEEHDACSMLAMANKFLSGASREILSRKMQLLGCALARIMLYQHRNRPAQNLSESVSEKNWLGVIQSIQSVEERIDTDSPLLSIEMATLPGAAMTSQSRFLESLVRLASRISSRGAFSDYPPALLAERLMGNCLLWPMAAQNVPVSSNLVGCVLGNPFWPGIAMIIEGVRPFVTSQARDLALAARSLTARNRCKKCHGQGKHPLSATIVARGDDPNAGHKSFACKDCLGSGCEEFGHLDNFRLNLLADALEEAGCPPIVERVCIGCGGLGERFDDWADYMDEDVFPIQGCRQCGGVTGSRGSGTMEVPHPCLAHLRDPSPHVRGCWVLDAILGQHLWNVESAA